MLDWKGNLWQRKEWERQRVVLDDVPLDERMVSALHISSDEQAAIDRIIDASKVDDVETFLVPPQSRYGNDELACTVASVSTIYHDQTLYDRM
jgi:hypothetical protein